MSEQSVNFGQLIERMKQARKDGAGHPTIIGGRFTANRLDGFLAVWRQRWDAMPWRIWEHVSEIEFKFANEPKALTYLQRAEVFGEGGHLSLRRDGNRWLWHYIGPPGQPAPAGFDRPPECEDFWAEHPDVELRRYKEHVLLWGEGIVDEDKKPTGRWWEDRVAAARLEYPPQLTGNARVRLEFWRFTENGQTAFVWYRGLSGGSSAPLEES